MTTIIVGAVCYAAAIIFPIPYVSRAILDGWAKLLSKVPKQ